MTVPAHPKPRSTRWTKEQIRHARSVPLAPLLLNRGLNLLPLETGNFSPEQHPGLLVKDNYWRWPERDLDGNTIDFFIRVLELSFHQAMTEITGS